ncbi:MAG: hypothetical protein ACKVIS_18935, partial [Pseudomonadales bacterium]
MKNKLRNLKRSLGAAAALGV